MELTAIYALLLFFIILIGITCIVQNAKNQSARQRARPDAIAQENIENAGSTEASAPVQQDIGRISEAVNNSFQIEDNEENANELCDLPPAYEDLFFKKE